MDGLGELRRLVEVGRRRLAPDEIGVRRICERSRDRRLDPGLDVEEAFGRALSREECVVALVDVARQERRGECVGSRDEDRRHVEDVGGEARRDERADELTRRDEHLAAEMPALLLGRELVLEVDGCSAGLDERLHQLERVERPAEAGFRVGDDRREPVRAVVAFRDIDLVGPEKSAVQPADERRSAVRGVEALVGVRVPGEIGVRGDLPAREVDGLKPGFDHLHGLGSGQGAERCDVRLPLEELPEPLRSETRERVLDPDGAAQAIDLRLAVRTLDAVPAAVCAAIRVAVRLPVLPHLLSHLPSKRRIVSNFYQDSDPR